MMEFLSTEVIASMKRLGVAQLEITAGKSLKIETSPRGEEVLDVEVPAGKAWYVELSVLITETNA